MATWGSYKEHQYAKFLLVFLSFLFFPEVPTRKGLVIVCVYKSGDNETNANIPTRTSWPKQAGGDKHLMD